MENLKECKIVKDNELIENFVFNATELELQILNYAVAITNPYWDNKDLVYKISIPDLVSIYKTKSKNAYKAYRDALARLQLRTYSYNNQTKVITENVLKKIIRDTSDSSYLELCFNNYISERIQNLKGFFTQYDIKNISMFTSRYAFMLYEFFKMKLQQNNGAYHQKISVEDFKSKLDMVDKYPVFAELKRNALDKAKTQINDYSDINLDYKVVKTGRTPTHIKFTAKFKKNHKGKWLQTEEKDQKGRVDVPTKRFTEEHKATAKKHLDKLKEKLKT